MDSYVTTDTLADRTQAWLKQIEPFNQHRMTVNAGQAALLVVDMQEFFMDPSSRTFTCGGPPIVPNVKRLIQTFRDADRPVIYTRHVHHPDRIDAGIMGWWWEGMCVEGSPESEVHAAIAPLPGEKQILKHRYSAFYNTDLETILRCMGIQDLVITGIMTNMCCESTARDAYYRDYWVLMPADGTGAVTEEMHVGSLLNLAFGFACITTCDELVSAVAEPAAQEV